MKFARDGIRADRSTGSRTFPIGSSEPAVAERGGNGLDALEENRCSTGRHHEDELIERTIEEADDRSDIELVYVLGLDATRESLFSTAESLRELSELAVQCGMVIQGCETQVLSRNLRSYHQFISLRVEIKLMRITSSVPVSCGMSSRSCEVDDVHVSSSMVA